MVTLDIPKRLQVRDCWERENLGIYFESYTALHVEPHEARVLLLEIIPGSNIVNYGDKAVVDRTGKSNRGRND